MFYTRKEIINAFRKGIFPCIDGFLVEIDTDEESTSENEEIDTDEESTCKNEEIDTTDMPELDRKNLLRKEKTYRK